MLNKYRGESKEQKEERRKAAAEGGKPAAKSKDQSVKCGINQIARLVESKKATMVVIAHDVSGPCLCAVKVVARSERGEAGACWVRVRRAANLAPACKERGD